MVSCSVGMTPGRFRVHQGVGIEANPYGHMRLGPRGRPMGIGVGVRGKSPLTNSGRGKGSCRGKGMVMGRGTCEGTLRILKLQFPTG